MTADNEGRRVLHPIAAKAQLIQAALRLITADYADEAADADAESEYADEQLALAAHALVTAVNAQPEDKRPVGWPS